MKLLLCINCSDIRALHTDVVSCKCGASTGRYINEINAEIVGPDAVALGINNDSLVSALIDQRDQGDQANGEGRVFEAFVIPVGASSVIRGA